MFFFSKKCLRIILFQLLSPSNIFHPDSGGRLILTQGGSPERICFQDPAYNVFGEKSGWKCNCLLLLVSSRCLREEPDYRIFNWPTLPSFIHLSHTGTLDPRNRMCDSQILPWSNPLTSQDLGHSIVNPSTTLFSLSHNDTLGLGHSIVWTTLPILSLCHHPLVTLLRLPWVVTLCVIMPPSSCHTDTLDLGWVVNHNLWHT